MMGELFFHTGVAQMVFDAFDKLFGKVRGRLSYVTVAGGTVFATLSGSSMANTALLGSSTVPRVCTSWRGYKPHMSLGPILGTGGLAIIIPPSALAVLRGSGLAQGRYRQNPDRRCASRTVVAGFYVATIFAQLRIDPEAGPPYEVKKIRLQEKLTAIAFGLAPMLLIVVVVIGVMLAGIATPSEAAAFGILGVLIASAFYRKLSAQAMVRALVGTIKTTAMVFLIIIGSSTFGQLLALSGATSGLVSWSIGLKLSPYLMLAVMLLVLLFLGCLIGASIDSNVDGSSLLSIGKFFGIRLNMVQYFISGRTRNWSYNATVRPRAVCTPRSCAQRNDV